VGVIAIQSWDTQAAELNSLISQMAAFGATTAGEAPSTDVSALPTEFALTANSTWQANG
jgi:hypothetical protein